ncbi:hypothetical protein [Roseobacter sp. CCS2]|uniref:hypothetical protein n=1 Tax=Roseobacter sp. CCS2 TaxID=391593 RepID=UPI0000F3C481|nr:hypothetical protein [Roseobacter sp. CCS2]EBA11778.1 hypothetical protein RCCS2_17656 [Roseobacter sp. CCS2]
MSANDPMITYRAKSAARAAEEAERVARVRASGTVPSECGDAIPAAPARGGVATFTPKTSMPDGEKGWKFENAGYRGRTGLRCADVFDRMMARSTPQRPCILTPSQIAMGRTYAVLTERYAAAGCKSPSLESTSGGGDPSAFIDAVLEQGQRLALIHNRIGMGVAKSIRRRRPSGETRVPITDRQLVDAVCLHDRSVSQVLIAGGWAKGNGNASSAMVADLMQALSATLTRMMGPVRSGRIMHTTLGSGPAPRWPDGQ